jgi:hypothetical protein
LPTAGLEPVWGNVYSGAIGYFDKERLLIAALSEIFTTRT